MLLLAGPSVYSKSRLEALRKQVQTLVPQITSLDAIFIHLVLTPSADAERILTNDRDEYRRTLDSILAYGDDVARPETRQACGSAAKNGVYVLPRPGSISPWSSKATDIARMCHLGDYVRRLERGVFFHATLSNGYSLSEDDWKYISHLLHDRMTQILQPNPPVESHMAPASQPRPLRTIRLFNLPSTEAKRALQEANVTLGLALTEDEIDYLTSAYVSGPDAIGRDPTDAELFMFAQVNSEHCRHKIFNANWVIDGVQQRMSLFDMIRNTERSIQGKHTISAYSDNAAVFEGYEAPRFAPGHASVYTSAKEHTPILVKVETHNHPTAVSPFPGAATGSGGEIRDEGAVGRGSKPKAGLAGFTVSNLLIPDYLRPWEMDYGKPAHIASSLDIMIEGPLGAAAFNNEFGRPALAGYFRTFLEAIPISETERNVRGYHKPIMIAGGLGNVRPLFAKKTQIAPRAKIVVLGGPGLLIGLGGGAASSRTSGASTAHLDFASVQRDNAEMQRRCQQVIDGCVNLGEYSPIQSIHDVGAGGLSNALPELVHDSNLGATFEIRDVLVDDASMSPMEIWCNESQERYVLAISPERFDAFEGLCKRERCPYAVVGRSTLEERLLVTDRLLGGNVIDLKMATLFSKPPKMSRTDQTFHPPLLAFNSSLQPYLSQTSSSQLLGDAVERVLRLPSVGSKSFLITIGDRSITGLVTRDQMVGPWQVPVADVAVTRTSYGFHVVTGEAMAMGERTPLSLISAAASARMAVGEAITNIAAASIEEIGRLKLSANWMCAASTPGEGARLYEAVKAIGEDLCPKLGVGIPVGKDSMSMSMHWKDGSDSKQVTAPLSLIITAFAPVDNVEESWTPQLQRSDEPTALVFFDLAKGKTRLGGSALAQVYKEIGVECPDVEDASLLRKFFAGCQRVRREQIGLILAYHDRSDGGLFTTIVEMCFAGRVGANVSLDVLASPADSNAILFAEELGAVVQVKLKDLLKLNEAFEQEGFPAASIYKIGEVENGENITITRGGQDIYTSTRGLLQAVWSETSFAIQKLRDDPSSAEQEFELITSDQNRGLFYQTNFTVPTGIPPELITRPRVAILREQGVNGQIEMAWAFTAAGFEAVDVHMSDILNQIVDLNTFRGIAACGGFSYGDVLGAGNGWAKSILLSQVGRRQFVEFFEREDTFALAVCNGCQMFGHLRKIIPGGSQWPLFKPNKSGRFEARVCMTEIVDTELVRQSPFLRDMVGWKIPVAVAHGEGRTVFDDAAHKDAFDSQNLMAIRYVDGNSQPTEYYPLNPNGSPGGLAGVHASNGRFLALMPHPERVITTESNSWHPSAMGRAGPWFQLFRSVRAWCGV